jgi:hypothetical protein
MSHDRKSNMTTPSGRQDQEKRPSVGRSRPPDASALRPRCGHPTDDGPCRVTILRLDGKCFRHSSETKPGEEREARQLGGRRATGRGDVGDVVLTQLRTRVEVAEAREEIYALLKAKVLSAPSGTTCLMALRDADTQRDKTEQRAIDRKGQRQRPQECRVIVRLQGWVDQLPAQPKQVGPAPEASR